MLVQGTTNACNSIISGISEPTQRREKDAFWNYLEELMEIFDLPWCLIRNFNELTNPTEKRGGQNYSCTKYQRLNNFPRQSHATCVPVNGTIYTWKK